MGIRHVTELGEVYTEPLEVNRVSCRMKVIPRTAATIRMRRVSPFGLVCITSSARNVRARPASLFSQSYGPSHRSCCAISPWYFWAPTL